MNHSMSVILAFFIGGLLIVTLFLVIYLNYIRTENKILNLLLSLLFFSIALRISKSSATFLLGNVSILIKSLGFLGLSLIGPFSYLYFKNAVVQKPKLILFDGFHFLFPIIGMSAYFTLGETLKISFYHIGTIILLVYLLVIGFRFKKSEHFKITKSKNTFNFKLLIGLFLICGAFLFQHISKNEESYVIGLIISTFIIYLLFFYVLKTKFYSSFNKTDQLSDDLINKVKLYLEEEKSYRIPEIKLSTFSLELNEPNYLVSKAINYLYKRSFPEVINNFRIQEIIQNLESNPDIKIEDLAYNAGFNSMSSFYYSFKKETNLSPRVYQEKYFLKRIAD